MDKEKLHGTKSETDPTLKCIFLTRLALSKGLCGKAHCSRIKSNSPAKYLNCFYECRTNLRTDCLFSRSKFIKNISFNMKNEINMKFSFNLTVVLLFIFEYLEFSIGNFCISFLRCTEYPSLITCHYFSSKARIFPPNLLQVLSKFIFFSYQQKARHCGNKTLPQNWILTTITKLLNHVITRSNVQQFTNVTNFCKKIIPVIVRHRICNAWNTCRPVGKNVGSIGLPLISALWIRSYRWHHFVWDQTDTVTQSNCTSYNQTLFSVATTQF